MVWHCLFSCSQLWPTSFLTFLANRQACVALSNHLISSPSVLTSSRNILELGAGVGLLSLVSARLLVSSETRAEENLRRIVATDVDEKVLEMLEGNVELSTSALPSFFPPNMENSS
jgi:predicted nicotinamide N-methyase